MQLRRLVVVEGIYALPAIMKLMKRYDIEMPIISAVNAVVKENADPAHTINALMRRDKKNEFSKSVLDTNFENASIKNK